MQNPDGSYNMPVASIMLQGAKVQLTGKYQNAQDIVLVRISTYTKYARFVHILGYMINL